MTTQNGNGASFKTQWLPPLLQMIGLIAGAFLFSQSIEHRITIIEEQLKMHTHMIQEMQTTARLLAEQSRLTERSLQRLIDLEEFLHGMSPDEAEAFYRRKMRERK